MNVEINLNLKNTQQIIDPVQTENSNQSKNTNQNTITKNKKSSTFKITNKSDECFLYYIKLNNNLKRL